MLKTQITNLKQQIKMIEQEIQRLEAKDNLDRFDKLKEALKNSGLLQITDVCEFDNRLYASLAISEFDKIKHLLPIAFEVGYSETEKNILRFEEGIELNTIAFNSLVERAKALEVQIDWTSGIEVVENKIASSANHVEDETGWFAKENQRMLDALKIEQNKQLLSD
jgi:hypothetical protein